MKPYFFHTAFGLGALAVVGVASMVAGSHFLVLAMTAVIAAVYALAALELRHYRTDTQALRRSLDSLPAELIDPSELNHWRGTLPLGLHNPVRQRIAGERVGLPGPALTPYAVGLLVMLGMLGTFLGMLVTLNGAVFALEGSSNVAGIRAAFSEPLKGLGLAFGTSVAGVATSAMLGLMSNLAKRERAQAAQQLDALSHTRLRVFSLSHQRQENHLALQQQAQALPQMLQLLQNMVAQMAHMALSSEQSNARLLANQHSFQQDLHSAFTALAQSVQQSLSTSLQGSMQLASDSIRPLVQASMAQLAEQAQRLDQRLLLNTQAQLAEIKTQMAVTAEAVAHTSLHSLTQHAQANSQMTERVGLSLHQFGQNFERSAQALVAQIKLDQNQHQALRNSTDQQRLQAWQAALEQMASTLHSQWQDAGTHTLAQQQAICDTLRRTAQDLTQVSQSQASQTMADIQRLLASSETLVQARTEAEAQWAAQHSQRAQALTAVLQTELAALREAEAQRGQAAVARLSDLQSSVAVHLTQLGTALEAPISRLIETAAQAPKTAAEVMGQLRQEISLGVARDNAMLDERTRILLTLSSLQASIDHTATQQRGLIDHLINASQATLTRTTEQFQAQVASETDKLGDIAAQVTASAADVASLGDTLGFALRHFSDTNDKLMGHLQRIEHGLVQSMTRSDEQLAYYVAQARELIELSIGSQKDVLDALQQRQTEGAA
jgi:hypothetical protein